VPARPWRALNPLNADGADSTDSGMGGRRRWMSGRYRHELSGLRGRDCSL